MHVQGCSSHVVTDHLTALSLLCFQWWKQRAGHQKKRSWETRLSSKHVGYGSKTRWPQLVDRQFPWELKTTTGTSSANLGARSWTRAFEFFGEKVMKQQGSTKQQKKLSFHTTKMAKKSTKMTIFEPSQPEAGRNTRETYFWLKWKTIFNKVRY